MTLVHSSHMLFVSCPKLCLSGVWWFVGTSVHVTVRACEQVLHWRRDPTPLTLIEGLPLVSVCGIVDWPHTLLCWYVHTACTVWHSQSHRKQWSLCTCAHSRYQAVLPAPTQLPVSHVCTVSDCHFSLLTVWYL